MYCVTYNIFIDNVSIHLINPGDILGVKLEKKKYVELCKEKILKVKAPPPPKKRGRPTPGGVSTSQSSKNIFFF